jgi:deoxyribodipyrimidine photolyase
MVDQKEEMRTKSDKFFTFFTEFFDKVNQVMPKIEEPKKEKKAGAATKKVVKTVARLNMMDELKAKQAQM